MSANDYLLLTKRGNKYRLSHRDADTNAEFEHWEFAELEEALAKAEEEHAEYQLKKHPEIERWFKRNMIIKRAES